MARQTLRAFLGGILPLSIFFGFLIPSAKPLDRLMFPLQTFYIGLFIYHLSLVLFGLQPAPMLMPGRTRSRFAVLVAAHNEEAVIGQLLASLRAQRYPAHLFRVFVVADACNDHTAGAAREAGAVVFERRDLPRAGKGAALDWLLHHVWGQQEEYDAVAIVDADNVVTRDFLQTMDAYLQRGDEVIQGYLGTKNPDDSWITRAIYASYAYTNRFFQLAKFNLGLSSSLGGTGLCIAMPLLRRLGWQCDALTEDLEFQIRAILAGVRPTWAWEAVVYDEKPLTFRVAFRQRLRWMQGHASVAFRYLGALLRRAIGAADPVAWDAVVYLAAPIWLAVALLISLVYMVNWFVPLFSYLYPPWVPPVLLLASLMYPYLALRLEGLPAGLYARPSTLAGVLLIGLSWPLLGFLGIVFQRRRTWLKTAHTRSLSIEDAGWQRAGLAGASPTWARLGTVRGVAGAMIALAIVATITPHLTARRLRPPLEEGGQFLLERRPEAALPLFVEAVSQQPEDPIAHAFLALTQRIMGNRLGALRSFARVRHLDPELDDTVVALGDFLLRHRQHPNAEWLLHEVLSSVRSGPEAYAWAANQFLDRRRLGEAEMIVQDGIHRFGQDVALLRVQGFLYLTQGRPAQAITILRLAHGKAPTDPGILINLGWAYVRLRQFPAAIQVWESALRLNPRNDVLRQDLEGLKKLHQP
ncbi:MAG TPA: glycosyltransferase [bacterium]|jgi:cellulose synthase/poly-beta-1,6-N-acetylglucosamine synthase-like glycosyltransferase/Flp pilus assembly protein TadD|nr:glycosyltransferase [bacterium]